MNYGKIVKEARLLMKQNQTDFGKSVGITQTYVSLLEKNAKKPSIDLLESIAIHTKKILPALLYLGIETEDFKRIL